VLRPVLVLLAAPAPLLVGLSSAWRITRERERGTLDGLLCTALHLICGVSGPILDLFFVRSDLSRRHTVATKAAINTIGHGLKFAWFTYALLASGQNIAPAAALLAMLLAPVGTQLSGRALDAITDEQFRTWSRRLIAAVAAFYLASSLATRF